MISNLDSFHGRHSPFREKFDYAADHLAAQNALRIGVLDTWTPTLTFATAGDLSVSYSTQVGQMISIGKLRFVNIALVATPTFSSASGNMQVTGLPVTCNAVTGHGVIGNFSGITKAGFTQFTSQLAASSSAVTFLGNASATSASAITAANVSSGVALTLHTQIIFEST